MTSSSGTYTHMDLTEVFERLPEVAMVLRPVIDVGEDLDPANATPSVHLAAMGPDQVSTDHRLVPLTSLPIWDVNGYYRALGITWPYRPSKKELRLAYQTVNGHDDERVTYGFKRLLDPEFRAHYDLRPLGEPVDDKYGWAVIAREASRWASIQTRLRGKVVMAEEFFGETMKAKLLADVKREKDPASTSIVATNTETLWPFAYYLFGSRKRDDRTLSDWQGKIIRSFRLQHLSVQVAVGYLGSTQAPAARVWHPRGGGHVEIIFLHEDVEPTEELADVVVGTYYKYPHQTPLTEPLFIDFPQNPADPQSDHLEPVEPRIPLIPRGELA